MQLVHQPLEFVILGALQRLPSVRRLRREIQHGRITPIVLVRVSVELHGGQQFDRRDAQLLEIVEARSRADTADQALVPAAQFRNDAGRGMHGHAAHVHLVENHVLLRSLDVVVIRPAFEPAVGLLRVDHDAVVARVRRGPGIRIADLREAVEALAVPGRSVHVEGVVLSDIEAEQGYLPDTVLLVHPHRVPLDGIEFPVFRLMHLVLGGVKDAEVNVSRAGRKQAIRGGALGTVQDHPQRLVGTQLLEDSPRGQGHPRRRVCKSFDKNNISF